METQFILSIKYFVWHVTVHCFNIKTISQNFNLRTKQNFVKHTHYNSVAFILSRVSDSSNRKRDFLHTDIRHYTEMLVKSELRRRKHQLQKTIYILYCKLNKCGNSLYQIHIYNLHTSSIITRCHTKWPPVHVLHVFLSLKNN